MIAKRHVIVGDVCSYSLMQRCWNENPHQRPPFSEIKTYLDTHLSVDPSKVSEQDSKSSEAAAYRPDRDGHENVQMADVIPADLSVHQSVVGIPPSSNVAEATAL